MLELVFAPAHEWIGRSEEDIMAATMKVGMAVRGPVACQNRDLKQMGPCVADLCFDKPLDH
jgi:hypothetical protein